MDNKEKIELMRRRIEFFYNEHRINARKHHHNNFYFLRTLQSFVKRISSLLIIASIWENIARIIENGYQITKGGNNINLMMK